MKITNIFCLILLLLLSANSYAYIMYYKSNGEKIKIDKDFPGENKNKIDLNSSEENERNQAINSILNFIYSTGDLPFKDDENHSLNLSSIQNMGDNSFAIRFTYNLDLSKIHELFPKKVPFASKNILVRIVNGSIESISSGIDSNFKDKVVEKIKKASYLYKINSKENFQKMQSSFKNLISFIKTEDENFLKIITALVKKNIFQFISFIKEKKGNKNDALTNYLAAIPSKIRQLGHCDNNVCLKDIFKDNSDLMGQYINLLEEWFVKISSKRNLLEVYLNEIIQIDSLQIHLDLNYNLHFIALSQGKDEDKIKIDLMIDSNGIRLNKIKMSSHLDSYNLIKSEILQLNRGKNKNVSEFIVTSNNFDDLNAMYKENKLIDPKDFISLFLLSNQKYFLEWFNFSQQIKKEPILVHYGIIEPHSNAKNASWSYFPNSKFLIGSGGSKYLNFHMQPDIIGHEYFHSIEELISNLYKSNESGSLKEHGGDLIGMIISDFINFKEDEMPKFGIGCNILTKESIVEYYNKMDKTVEGYEKNSDQICLRNFLKPELSFANQATNKASISNRLGQNYLKDCTDSFDNDYCGIHFQTSIPNRILSQFMIKIKEKKDSMSWIEIKNTIAKIIFNTFAGRLQSDAGFLAYGQQLNLECQNQFNNTNRFSKPETSSLCMYLEVEFNKHNSE